MLDIVSYLKNIALVVGTKKADEAVDGAEITAQVIAQVEKFMNNQKKSDEIKWGPLKNFMREMYSGLFHNPEVLRQDLVEWCASLKEDKTDGRSKTQEKSERGNQGNFGPGGHK